MYNIVNWLENCEKDTNFHGTKVKFCVFLYQHHMLPDNFIGLSLYNSKSLTGIEIKLKPMIVISALISTYDMTSFAKSLAFQTVPTSVQNFALPELCPLGTLPFTNLRVWIFAKQVLLNVKY